MLSQIYSGWGKKINFLQTSLGILLFSQRKKKFSLCVCMSLYVFIFWSPSNRSSTEASNNYHLFGLPLKKIHLLNSSNQMPKFLFQSAWQKKFWTLRWVTLFSNLSMCNASFPFLSSSDNKKGKQNLWSISTVFICSQTEKYLSQICMRA